MLCGPLRLISLAAKFLAALPNLGLLEDTGRGDAFKPLDVLLNSVFNSFRVADGTILLLLYIISFASSKSPVSISKTIKFTAASTDGCKARLS